MDAISAALALKALDCLSLRAEATASNIANAGTRGYQPLSVNFETALTDAAARGPEAIAAFQPRLSRDVDPLAGPGLRLDRELATASSTGLRYAALIEILNRRLQIEASALGGGA